MKRIAVFASGSGTNMENIAKYLEKGPIKVCGVFTNNEHALVINRAKKLNIPIYIFNRDEFLSGKILKSLQDCNPDLIVLAGFLWLIPFDIISAFENRIINIHPALLPKYGGKGMYGDNVHKEVIKNKENESGITIHYVNELYDEGSIIFQKKCSINKSDTYESLAKKIHELEYQYYPQIIESLLL